VQLAQRLPPDLQRLAHQGLRLPVSPIASCSMARLFRLTAYSGCASPNACFRSPAPAGQRLRLRVVPVASYSRPGCSGSPRVRVASRLAPFLWISSAGASAAPPSRSRHRYVQQARWFRLSRRKVRLASALPPDLQRLAISGSPSRSPRRLVRRARVVQARRVVRVVSPAPALRSPAPGGPAVPFGSLPSTVQRSELFTLAAVSGCISPSACFRISSAWRISASAFA